MTIIYKIEFFTYWHTGSGLSGGTYADMLVNKTNKNLPFIPGKTLKGLLREAADFLHSLNEERVTAGFISDVFGENPNREEKEVYKTEGQAFFSNAELSRTLTVSIDEKNAGFLYDVFSSTKIDENGLAANHSLRQIEVTAPLILYAKADHFPDKEGYKKQFTDCLKMVKQLGVNRSRGLGRCQLSVIEN